MLQAPGVQNASPSRVHILGKVRLGASGLELIAGCIDALKYRNTARSVQHLPRINRGGIAQLAGTARQERVGGQILYEAVNDTQEDIHSDATLKL